MAHPGECVSRKPDGTLDWAGKGLDGESPYRVTVPTKIASRPGFPDTSQLDVLLVLLLRGGCLQDSFGTSNSRLRLFLSQPAFLNRESVVGVCFCPPSSRSIVPTLPREASIVFLDQRIESCRCLVVVLDGLFSVKLRASANAPVIFGCPSHGYRTAGGARNNAIHIKSRQKKFIRVSLVPVLIPSLFFSYS